jgi:hypothetical protein
MLDSHTLVKRLAGQQKNDEKKCPFQLEKIAHDEVFITGNTFEKEKCKDGSISGPFAALPLSVKSYE